MSNILNHKEIAQRLDSVGLIGSITFFSDYPSKPVLDNIEAIFYEIMKKVNNLNVFDFHNFVNEIKNDEHNIFHQIESEAISFICRQRNIKNTNFLKDIMFLIRTKRDYDVY